MKSLLRTLHKLLKRIASRSEALYLEGKRINIRKLPQCDRGRSIMLGGQSAICGREGALTRRRISLLKSAQFDQKHTRAFRIQTVFISRVWNKVRFQDWESFRFDNEPNSLLLKCMLQVIHPGKTLTEVVQSYSGTRSRVVGRSRL